MRQLIAVITIAILVVILWLGGYLLYYRRGILPFTDKRSLAERVLLSNRELEEEMVFFLVRQLGIYEGDFEVMDVVHLEMRELMGADYLLVTLRIPDGRLCQVIVSRKSSPWAKWKIEPGTFNLMETPGKTAFLDDTEPWMKELGVTAEEVRQYYRACPEAISKGEEGFLDKETGSHRLPADWFKAVKPSGTGYKLSINKNEPARFVPGIKSDPADAVWSPDYPANYLGGGYRSYLHEKVKKE